MTYKLHKTILITNDIDHTSMFKDETVSDNDFDTIADAQVAAQQNFDLQFEKIIAVADDAVVKSKKTFNANMESSIEVTSIKNNYTISIDYVIVGKE